jgi:DNA-binding transcriptional ArsR family regulator
MPPLDVDLVMRTLADPTRRAVFEQIVAAGEISAGALTRGARVSQPAVSQHLRALRLAALVVERRAGRNVLYRARPQGLAPLVDWLGTHAALWRDSFANLKVLLKEIDHDAAERDNAKRRHRRGAAARA